MKVVISKEDLVSLISKIQNIIPTKPAIPVLSNVLIEAIDGQLILCATDLTTSMRCVADAKVIEEGATALPARRFFQLVRELTTPQIKISTKGNNVAEIIAGSSVFKINGINKSDFPTFPEIQASSQISISSSMLKEMLSRTAFACAREDNRYMLNGLLLKISNAQTTLIATDGKRLAKMTAEVDIDPSFQGTYILPIKSVEEMVKLLDENKERTSLCLMHDKVILDNTHSLLITKLLAGQYPDVERVIPQNSPLSISLHREELIALLRQVSLFVADTSQSIRFAFSKGMLELDATTSNIGEGKVNMPADYHGDNLQVAFNPHYFQDILRHSKDETVTFSIQDAYNPGMITDSSSAIFVIMPMKLNEIDPSTEPEQEEDAINDSVFA